MAWTKNQEQAIYQKGDNILVAAAAGSGKTAVLVERIIASCNIYKCSSNRNERACFRCNL